MGNPLDPKGLVTLQDLAVSTASEIAVLAAARVRRGEDPRRWALT